MGVYYGSQLGILLRTNPEAEFIQSILNLVFNPFPGGIFIMIVRLLGKKVQLAWSIGCVARSVKMLSGKQVAALKKHA
jgi:hypothetical protein